jgi:hypothetical protein
VDWAREYQPLHGTIAQYLASRSSQSAFKFDGTHLRVPALRAPGEAEVMLPVQVDSKTPVRAHLSSDLKALSCSNLYLRQCLFQVPDSKTQSPAPAPKQQSQIGASVLSAESKKLNPWKRYRTAVGWGYASPLSDIIDILVYHTQQNPQAAYSMMLSEVWIAL